ncbi:MAG: flagellar protein [Rhizobiales bacterium]|nr:flagellar protein [Hyphomicrobiales bacterium]
MTSNITLSAGVRSNLLNLQNTADAKNLTQTRLSTGKKVNSALDNPSNFFTAASLSSRASDLSNLLDGMANGIQTIQAANNGLTSITTTLQSMQSTLNQARQDKSFQTQSYDMSSFVASGAAGSQKLSIKDGAIGATAIDVSLTKAVGATAIPATSGSVTGTTAFSAPINLSASGSKISFDLKVDGSPPTTITLNKAAVDLSTGRTDGTINNDLEMISAIATAAITAGAPGAVLLADQVTHKITIQSTTTGPTSSVDISNLTTDDGLGGTLSNVGGLTNGNGVGAVSSTSPGTTTALTVDELVSSINGNTSLTGKVTASNDNGKLRLQNLSTADLTVAGVASGKVDGSTSTAAIAGNSVRTALAKQFNDLRDQITKFGDDASFNGVNLLRGDNLKLTLNETGTSFINVQTKDKSGNATSIDNTFLKTDSVTASEFDSDGNIDTKLDTIKDALSSIRSASSSLGSQLSSVQARKDFTKNMINTLQVGSDNLTLADTNEEGANLLALNTRQSLQTTSLSFASQADQAVLQFLR